MPSSKSLNNQNCIQHIINSTQIINELLKNVTTTTTTTLNSINLEETSIISASSSLPSSSIPQTISIYNLSYLWFSFLAVFIVFFIGSIISLFESKKLNTKIANINNEDLLFNFNLNRKFIKYCVKSSSSSSSPHSYSFNLKNKQEMDNEMDNFISK
jgi:hypothetical protein